ncbi:MAG: hypothetical protein JXJ19_05230 [Elusimicrobia bacterium]|nr:hypothetical protein [Elusimicrobiota bacterium]
MGNNSGITDINEPVKVGAVFENSRIRPKWFVWKKKKYILRKITYDWVDSSRGDKHLCFSVWDGRNMYELSYSTRFFTWMLDRVHLE